MNENYMFEARIVDTMSGETLIKISSYTLEGLEEELYKLEKFIEEDTDTGNSNS
jgi:hypothetical protein